MEELFSRIFDDLIARVSGPMYFRLLLQPLMATIFAVRAGLSDARAGKPAYFWALFTQPAHRGEMLREGWKQVGKVFVLAMVLDIAYQLIVQGYVYPFEVVFVAFILAIVPYLAIRGPINRIASRAGMTRDGAADSAETTGEEE